MTHILFCDFGLSLLLIGGFLDVMDCVSGDGKSVWNGSQAQDGFLSGTFSKGFLWGVGTAAFPTEGSLDVDGKGQSIWDSFLQKAGMNDTFSNSYSLWEKDIEAIEYLGVKFYSFSISWPRIFPDGIATGLPNHAAVKHYQRLIGRLRALKLEPVVTLFHWDLPQQLQDNLGGWRNPKLVQLFTDYARFCFQMFGRDVRYWITIHNPLLVAYLGYGAGIHAPGLSGGDLADTFLIAHNLIRAHAKTWHIYNDLFRPHQHGKISITLGSHWVEPYKGMATQSNVELCQKSMETVIGWFAEPIHGNGDYPGSLRSSHPGLVPNFTSEEKLWVRGTADFFSLAFGPNSVQAGQALARFGQTGVLDLRKILVWIQREYEDPEVLVAESGWFSDSSVGVEDTVAMFLMKRFINQVLQAAAVDKVRVFGYTAWSLVDGYEWNNEYSIRRGLFYINFNQDARTRVPKTTAQYYREIVKHNGFPAEKPEREIDGRFPCDFQFGVADFILQVHLQPFSPQFTDPLLYRWNFSGDGSLSPVLGVKLHTRPSQCTDFLTIQRHVRLLETIGALHYRFALDWPRLFPKGNISSADSETVRYYKCMLTELQKKGIQVAVTLYHPSMRSHTLGLPNSLHAQGGWMNASTTEAFADYAKFCFQKFGMLVKFWITINEPNRLAEVYNVSGEDQQMVVRNLLKAHACAWNIYHTQFRLQQGATLSFALHADWIEPANPFIKSHTDAAQQFLLFELARFLDPFLKDGNDAVSIPLFSNNEKLELKNALDFIALNHFTTRLIQPKSIQEHDWMFMTDPTWLSSNKRQAIVPWGLRRILKWVKNRYGDSHSVVITATGIDDQAPHDDQLRQKHLQTYLNEALKARDLDGIDLRGFYIWKLQDHHSPDFGLFLSSHHHSQPKVSVSIYRDIISHRGLSAISISQGNDHMTSSCELNSSKVMCWICENEPLLFFCVCVTVSLFVLIGGIITVVCMKRRMMRLRNRRRNKAIMRVPY